MNADDGKPWALTRRKVLESGAAFAILGYVRPGFAAEVNPTAPPVLPDDPGVSSWIRAPLCSTRCGSILD
jgi:hypothetical protein